MHFKMNLPQKWNPQTWRKIDFYTDFYWNIWHNNKLVSIVENCIILIHTVLYHYRHIISTMIKMFFDLDAEDNTPVLFQQIWRKQSEDERHVLMFFGCCCFFFYWIQDIWCLCVADTKPAVIRKGSKAIHYWSLTFLFFIFKAEATLTAT